MTLTTASFLAATISVFGSTGAETQLTPANAASPLNPGNVAAIPYRTIVADATAFVDATSSDERWKARLKLRADASDRAVDRGEISEAFVQVAATDWLDLTAGRVIERWGTGYGWTPTSFVGPPKRAVDPNDRRFTDAGRDMVRASVFIDGTTLSAYLLEGGAVAARGYRLIAGSDVSVVYRRDDGLDDFGVSLARVFGESLELHAELARTRHMRAVIGGQYTFPRKINVVFEIYHGTDGLTASQWEAFREMLRDDVRRANAAYVPLKMGRTYAFVRLSRPFRKMETELIAIANVRDGSALVRGSVTYRLRPNVALYAIDTEFIGRRGSELAHVQVERVTNAGVRVYF